MDKVFGLFLNRLNVTTNFGHILRSRIVSENNKRSSQLLYWTNFTQLLVLLYQFIDNCELHARNSVIFSSIRSEPCRLGLPTLHGDLLSSCIMATPEMELQIGYFFFIVSKSALTNSAFSFDGDLPAIMSLAILSRL